MSVFFFFFNDTATTEIYTLSLHDALPILVLTAQSGNVTLGTINGNATNGTVSITALGSSGNILGNSRSEEHTSELQSPCNLVCRLLLEKKNNLNIKYTHSHTYISHWVIRH